MKFVWALTMLAGIGLGLWLGWAGWPWPQGVSAAALRPEAPAPSTPLDKDEIAFLISRAEWRQQKLDRLRVPAEPGRAFVIETTIDADLQSFAFSKLEQAHAPLAALAALEPATGRVRALVSFSSLEDAINYAVTPAFPAASIFKMVTAAAAMEAGGLTPASKIPFNGRSHTLYRGQLKNKKNKWTRTPSLADSFARSVNPVFGKLALNRVGPGVLEEFALRFGFNQAIRFELAVDPSRVKVPVDDAYALAEIGSGFNRETTLSPLHGALMAAAVVKGGTMVEPSVVQRVRMTEQGRTEREVYQSQTRVLRQVFSPQTAEDMRRLMRATIKRGTCRSYFRRASRDRVLKALDIGGKTGSINDPTGRYRIDWFVGYAQDKKSKQALSLAVVVAHDLDYRGVRAARVARDVLRHYFEAPKLEPGSGPRATKRQTIETAKGQPS